MKFYYISLLHIMFRFKRPLDEAKKCTSFSVWFNYSLASRKRLRRSNLLT